MRVYYIQIKKRGRSPFFMQTKLLSLYCLVSRMTFAKAQSSLLRAKRPQSTYGACSPLIAAPPALELEVNERAAVCAHELVNHEDDERRYSNHRRNRERCERDAVAGLELLRNPVDEHACNKHEDNVDVFHCDGVNCIPAPCGTHLVHHVLCRVPCDFVCFGRVEVRACAEEETRERDEHECERNVPCGCEPRQCLVAEQMVDDGRVNAHEEYAKPYRGNRTYRNCVMLVEDGAYRKESKRN